MKIAIIHDYLNQYGGAERVVETMHELFPDAPIYTSIYLPEELPNSFKSMNIITSFVQNLPFVKKHFKKYFLFYPLAFKMFDLSRYDLILSSSSAYAKGVRVPSNAIHICYCYTPARFIWRYAQYMEKEKINKIGKSIVRYLTILLQKWDIDTAKKVDYFIASCKNVKERIWEIYKKDAYVIYPPVQTNKFYILNKKMDYFLLVSRLVAYKRIDIVIEAFNRLKLPLKIIGRGPYYKYLIQNTKPNIEFLGVVNDAELSQYYAHCRAVISPAEEDFGIVPVEAQAAGCPVIAYGRGGALETVVENKTGVFFYEQTTEALISAINKFCVIEKSFDSLVIRKNAERFSEIKFKEEFKNFVDEKISSWKGPKSTT